MTMTLDQTLSWKSLREILQPPRQLLPMQPWMKRIGYPFVVDGESTFPIDS